VSDRPKVRNDVLSGANQREGANHCDAEFHRDHGMAIGMIRRSLTSAESSSILR
jgi:hypothetical protein